MINTHTSSPSRKRSNCQDDSGYILELRTSWIFQLWVPEFFSYEYLMNISNLVCVCRMNRQPGSISHVNFIWNEMSSHALRSLHDVTESTKKWRWFFFCKSASCVLMWIPSGVNGDNLQLWSSPSRGFGMGGWIIDQRILKEKITSILRETYPLEIFPPVNTE